MKQSSLVCGGIMITASMAIGHPGHEAIVPAGDPLHYLINPAHLVMAMAATSLVAGVLWLCRRTRSKICYTTQKD